MAGSVADLVVEIAFTTDPLSTSPSWTDVSQYVRHEFGVQIQRGRGAELDDFQPGTLSLVLDNRTRRFDPSYTSGAYYPNVKPGKAIRVRALWSGTYYTRFFGFIDSWPQEYADGKVDATVQIDAVDGLTVLSEMVLPDPVFKYTLSTIGSCALFLRNNDGSTWFDESGNGRHATLSVGSTVSPVAPGTWTVPTREKPRTGTERFTGGAIRQPGVYGTTSISTSLAAGLTSPSVTGGKWTWPSVSLGSGAWSISFWFSCSAVAADTSVAGARYATLLGTGAMGVTAGDFEIIVQTYQAFSGVQGGVVVSEWDTSFGFGAQPSFARVNDGKPHHLVVTNTAGAVQSLYIDGVLQRSDTTLNPYSVSLTNADLTLQKVVAGSYVSTDPPEPSATLQDLSLFTKTLSAAEVTGLYQRGLGQLPETSSARVSRLIADTDWPTAWVNTTTNPKGTCVDYTVAFQGLMDALSEVAATEQGRLFVDAAGVLQLHGRYAYLETTRGKTVQAIFSDDGSDIPIKQTGTDNSTREVQNEITVVATLGVSAQASDSTSITAYRRRPVTISTLLPGTAEATDMATGLLFHRKDMQARTRGAIEVQPAAKTTNWPTVLGLEIGDRVQREITPLVGSQSVLLLTVEGIDEDITVDDWVIGFHGSPVPGGAAAGSTFLVLDDATYGVLGTARLGY